MAVTIYTEGAYPSDWLKREEDSLYSRDQVTLASGSNAAGSATVAGILLNDIDASVADKRAVIISRDAIVMQYALTYGADVTTSGNRATVNTGLNALGIVVREGA
jgi:hypothetical protein